MILRLMQFILFFPCCILDGLALFILSIPMYVFCGIKITSRESLLQWLFELKKQ